RPAETCCRANHLPAELPRRHKTRRNETCFSLLPHICCLSPPAITTGARGSRKTHRKSLPNRTAVPDTTSRIAERHVRSTWLVAWPWSRADRDGMGAELTFQQLEQGLLIGRWWCRWPQVSVRGVECWDVLLVNDFQRPAVSGAFVTVTVQ